MFIVSKRFFLAIFQQFGIISRLPKSEEDIRKLPKMSESSRRCLKAAEDVRTLPKMSKDCRRCPKTAEDVQRLPKMSFETAKDVHWLMTDDIWRLPQIFQSIRLSTSDISALCIYFLLFWFLQLWLTAKVRETLEFSLLAFFLFCGMHFSWLVKLLSSWSLYLPHQFVTLRIFFIHH